MSDHEGNGYDSCKGYQDSGDTYSELRDDCPNAMCAAATDFSAAAAYTAAAICYSSKK